MGPCPGTAAPPDNPFSLGSQKSCGKRKFECVILPEKTLHGAAHRTWGRGVTGRWTGQAMAPRQDGGHSKVVLSLATKS